MCFQSVPLIFLSSVYTMVNRMYLYFFFFFFLYLFLSILKQPFDHRNMGTFTNSLHFHRKDQGSGEIFLPPIYMLYILIYCSDLVVKFMFCLTFMWGYNLC